MTIERTPGGGQAPAHEKKKEIIPEWFSVNEGPGGISASFSPEFLQLGNGKIAQYMLKEEDEMVRKITGFSIYDLEKMRKEMKKRYREHGATIDLQ